MQSITPRQLRSARTFLGWSQKYLSSLLGVSIPSLYKWEQDGRSIPKGRLPAIREVFGKQGIEFIEDKGFLKGSTRAKSYSGSQGLRTLFDDMYNELSQDRELEVCVMGVDEAHFFERLDFAELHTHRMQRLMPQMRVLKGPSKLKHLQSYAEYKIASTVHFNSTPVYIYGNKVVLMSWEPLEATVIENSAHQRSFKELFEHLWSNATA